MQIRKKLAWLSPTNGSQGSLISATTGVFFNFNHRNLPSTLISRILAKSPGFLGNFFWILQVLTMARLEGLLLAELELTERLISLMWDLEQFWTHCGNVWQKPFKGCHVRSVFLRDKQNFKRGIWTLVSIMQKHAPETYSTSDNETPPISRALIGRHLIFCWLTSPPCCNSPQNCTSIKYMQWQKAGFPIVTWTPSRCSLRRGDCF